MKILLVKNSVVPPKDYGGTERVVYWLANSLQKIGHQVTILCAMGSVSSKINIQLIDPSKPIEKQIGDIYDIVHFHDPYKDFLSVPYINTIHGVADPGESYSINSVFVSHNQAKCHAAEAVVYHGLDYSEYGIYNKNQKKDYLHFLAKTRWKIKNIDGAIAIANKANKNLEVMGNNPIEKVVIKNIFSTSVHFNGMIAGDRKNEIMAKSTGLIFPTLCQETFGLSMFESMYHGCPVYGTTYGSLPELILPEVGYLAINADDLANAIKNASYNFDHIHQYATDLFSAEVMAKNYIKVYEQVLNGQTLNKTEPIYQKEYLDKTFEFEM
jgi:glycosyltransferase involved in cell wall biosynthesis